MKEKVEQNGDPVQNAMGEIGKWQLSVCFFICLLNFPAAWQHMNIIFIAAKVPFECADQTLERCDKNCSEWVYDDSIFSQTIITQWNLVCSRKSLVNWSQTIVIFGILLGNFIFGVASDKIGRRPPLLFAVVLQLFAGVATAFAPWYWLFCVLRFILAISIGGATSFIIMMEIMGPKWRELVCLFNQIPFNIGHLMLAGLAYFIRDWRYLQLAVSVPSLLLFSYYYIIPESPRYLFVVGRLDESITILEKAAKRNKLPTENIRTDIEEYAKTKSDPRAKGKVLDVFKTPNMRRKTIYILLFGFTGGLSYMGVAQYMGHIEGDIFVNVAISASFSILGTASAFFLSKSFNRKPILIFTSILSGVCMLGTIFTPQEMDLVNVTLVTSAFVMINIATPVTLLLVGEIFPTVIRNIGLAFLMVTTKLGSMVAPFAASSGDVVVYWLPPAIFGLASLLGVIFVCFLPETKGFKIPETLEDAENFEENKSRIN